jgi:hypothetical protein
MSGSNEPRNEKSADVAGGADDDDSDGDLGWSTGEIYSRSIQRLRELDDG